MQITDFNKPDRHPFGMMQGYKQAAEKEQILTWLLNQCVDAGEWVTIGGECDALVADGFLTDHGDNIYCLTNKAKGYLYAYFGKD
jgi:hypothetical protein